MGGRAKKKKTGSEGHLSQVHAPVHPSSAFLPALTFSAFERRRLFSPEPARKRPSADFHGALPLVFSATSAAPQREPGRRFERPLPLHHDPCHASGPSREFTSRRQAVAESADGPRVANDRRARCGRGTIPAGKNFWGRCGIFCARWREKPLQLRARSADKSGVVLREEAGAPVDREVPNPALGPPTAAALAACVPKQGARDLRGSGEAAGASSFPGPRRAGCIMPALR